MESLIIDFFGEGFLAQDFWSPVEKTSLREFYFQDPSHRVCYFPYPPVATSTLISSIIFVELICFN